MNATFNSGICTNLPTQCSHAAARSSLPMADEQARCPECGSRLLSTSLPTGAHKTSRATWAMAALVVGALSVIGAGSWWAVHRTSEPSAPTAARTQVPAETSTSLRLHGSNTVGSVLAPALMQAFLKSEGFDEVSIQPGAAPEERVLHARQSSGNGSVAVELHAHGSSTAFEGLAQGKADIGMSSRTIKPNELEATRPLGDLSKAGGEYVIALDGVAVIVHPGNPIQQLSLSQLRDIYAGRIQSWDQLGGEKQPIHLLARDDKSGTWDTFKVLVMDKDPLANGARRFEDSQQLSDAVSLDPQAIGFVGLPYVQNARALAISDGNSTTLRPSRFTVATEDYALTRRLYLYVGRQAPEFAHRFAQFAVSDAGQKIAESQGFIGQIPEETGGLTEGGRGSDGYRDLVRQGRRLSVNLRFLPNSDTLDNKGRRDLQRIVHRLEQNVGQHEHVMLLGFADNSGAPCDNERLSRQRAQAVARELATFGLQPAVVHGFGSAAPVAANDTPSGRERNRRVEVWIARNDAKAPASSACPGR